MEFDTFLNHVNSRLPVIGGSEMHQYMSNLSYEAIKITMEINNTLYRLRKEYPYRETCFYKFRLLFSGSGRNYHW